MCIYLVVMYARKKPVVGLIPFALPGLTGLCIGITYWLFRLAADDSGRASAACMTGDSHTRIPPTLRTLLRLPFLVFPAPKLEPLGQKIRARSDQNGFTEVMGDPGDPKIQKGRP